MQSTVSNIVSRFEEQSQKEAELTPCRSQNQSQKCLQEHAQMLVQEISSLSLPLCVCFKKYESIKAGVSSQRDLTFNHG